MKVRDLMSENVKCADPNQSLVEVAQILASSNIGSVPVCQGQQLTGMVTDRDILVRAIAEGKDPQTTKVSEVMTKDVHCVSPDTDIHQASDLMAENQIRRLPVIENNQLVGVLAIGDIAVQSIHVDEAGEALSSISEKVYQ
ncbi:CBS domain-containing protein [Desulfitobacterium sp.]|uniref:CBS domain-containing protein n=1 Tax=Desulfitobacterium sp. TaxID=49981 RepID=UPI002B2040E0|nr:CBS domain-containing protein [Desulfitobacterium sp.]MEA4901989.1 CBS domain-containing protein [Desulfitobacterium sp.]